MAKTSRQVLTAIVKGNRFTRAEVAVLIKDGGTWAENAETWAERFDAIAEFDTEIGTDGLADIRVPVDIMDKSKGHAHPFTAVAEAIETIAGAAELAREIKGTLTELQSIWGTFEGYASTWVDEDTDQEDVAEARSEMEGVGEDLDTNLGDLDDYGLDLSVEP